MMETSYRVASGPLSPEPRLPGRLSYALAQVSGIQPTRTPWQVHTTMKNIDTASSKKKFGGVPTTLSL